METQIAPDHIAPSASEVFPVGNGGQPVHVPVDTPPPVAPPSVTRTPVRRKVAPVAKRGRPKGSKNKVATVTKKGKAKGKVKIKKVRMAKPEILRALQTARGWVNRCIQAMGGK